MEKFNSLNPSDEITVTIWGPENSRLYQSTNSGYTSVEEAVRIALANAALIVKPEDCLFEITDQNTFVSHTYRLSPNYDLIQQA